MGEGFERYQHVLDLLVAIISCSSGVEKDEAGAACGLYALDAGKKGVAVRFMKNGDPRMIVQDRKRVVGRAVVNKNQLEERRIQ